MRILVLGAAAGGGFPQWNCNCPGCQRGRAGESSVKPRTQAALALTADGQRWALLNASPDLPYQIRANPELHPAGNGGIRHSPISTVVLTGGDVDCIAGLLSLRESQQLRLYAAGYVRAIIEDNPIFRVLNRDLVRFSTLPMDQPIDLQDASGAPLGLTLEAFAVAGKIPLYYETSDDITQLASSHAVIGLAISGNGKRILYIPGCAAVTDALRARVEGAGILFFDGTLWQDNEMIRAGIGRKTGQRMGHMSISGAGGSIAAFAGVELGQKIFIHINNTNPILCDDSPEAAAVRNAGWQIAHDGMALSL
jgi:pyrroloquinoline quinone biosynthesis protein B